MKRSLASIIVVLTLGACPAKSDGPAPKNGTGSASKAAVTAGGSGDAGGGAAKPMLAGSLAEAIARHRPPPKPTPLTTHPRLWVTRAELPHLRKLASDDNPIYKSGLGLWIKQAIRDMDAGKLRKADDGLESWQQYPVEMYAQLFAFASLIAADASDRKDYARRSRELLMHIMKRAAKGPKDGKAYRDPQFATRNRARWWGEAFGLTVDWIYPHLSKADKATIRKVFLLWGKQRRRAGTTDYNHPVPAWGVTNDARLLRDATRVRWSLNNYYNGHMRNNVLAALAFDAADDPGGKLQAILANAIGAWFYVTDKALSTVSRGGLGAEGALYSPAAIGYDLQVLLALHTAGRDDPDKLGKQVIIENNSFWADLVPAYFHTVSPRTVVYESWVGPVHHAAIYGDAQEFQLLDPIDMFGPLGIYDRLRGNKRRLQAIRWLQVHDPPGGTKLLKKRLKGESVRSAILYFLLLADAPPPTRDPRKNEPLVYHSPGLGQLYSRTDWSRDATWVQFQVGWTTIDHQHGDGNNFGFYRKGEWLTRERSGWHTDNYCTDLHNSVTIGNDKPNTMAEEAFRTTWKRGCQWLATMANGRLRRWSSSASYLYALGDATELYNAPKMKVRGVSQATRSLLWLKPDVIVIYDRAETAKRRQRRFKRWHLQLPVKPKINGSTATIETKGGQRLVVTSLLPPKPRIRIKKLGGQPAKWDPMHWQIRVDRRRPPARERFLHVIEARDGAGKRAVALLRSGDGKYVGARVGKTALLFPHTLGAAPTALSASLPAAVQRALVTGLRPGARYTGALSGGKLTLRAGGSDKADAAGVLRIGR